MGHGMTSVCAGWDLHTDTREETRRSRPRRRPCSTSMTFCCSIHSNVTEKPIPISLENLIKPILDLRYSGLLQQTQKHFFFSFLTLMTLVKKTLWYFSFNYTHCLMKGKEGRIPLAWFILQVSRWALFLMTSLVYLEYLKSLQFLT